MESNFPRNIVQMDYRILYQVAMLYVSLGNKARFDEYATEVENYARQELKRNPNDIQSYFNPYRILLDIYEAKGDRDKQLEILYMIDRITPNRPEIKAKIEALKNPGK